ncbi:MAG: hypothetical protein DRH89_09155 [Candidatus Cloacimonadota bacterium]|nr:MAG: hypothetical protein DRH89_09155 [Candidatus Cloacimonadota bacterium]
MLAASSVLGRLASQPGKAGGVVAGVCAAERSLVVPRECRAALWATPFRVVGAGERPVGRAGPGDSPDVLR